MGGVRGKNQRGRRSRRACGGEGGGELRAQRGSPRRLEGGCVGQVKEGRREGIGRKVGERKEDEGTRVPSWCRPSGLLAEWEEEALGQKEAGRGVRWRKRARQIVRGSRAVLAFLIHASRGREMRARQGSPAPSRAGRASLLSPLVPSPCSWSEPFVREHGVG